MLRIGKNRHKAIIQSTSQAADSYGALVDTWSTFATWWVTLSPLSGKESFSEGKVNTETTIKLTGRYIANVKPAMRVVFGSRIFSIVEVLNVGEMGHEMTMLCKEID
jgi:SPP1 family predicted phage head-tail adaptor